MTLFEKTVQLLRETKKTQKQIAEETGLGYWWITTLSQGKVQDATVNKVQKLYEYLSGKKLVV